MKTYRNHHTRNRTRRRRMKGGFSIPRMQVIIDGILTRNNSNFTNVRKNLNELIKSSIDNEQFIWSNFDYMFFNNADYGIFWSYCNYNSIPITIEIM